MTTNSDLRPPTRWLIVVLVMGAGIGLLIGGGISLLAGDSRASAIQTVIGGPCVLAGSLALNAMRAATSRDRP